MYYTSKLFHVVVMVIVMEPEYGLLLAWSGYLPNPVITARTVRHGRLGCVQSGRYAPGVPGIISCIPGRVGLACPVLSGMMSILDVVTISVKRRPSVKTDIMIFVTDVLRPRRSAACIKHRDFGRDRRVGTNHGESVEPPCELVTSGGCEGPVRCFVSTDFQIIHLIASRKA